MFARLPPDPPRECQVISTSAYSVRLAWAPAFSSSDVKVTYNVRYRQKWLKNHFESIHWASWRYEQIEDGEDKMSKVRELKGIQVLHKNSILKEHFEELCCGNNEPPVLLPLWIPHHCRVQVRWEQANGPCPIHRYLTLLNEMLLLNTRAPTLSTTYFGQKVGSKHNWIDLGSAF